MCALPTKTNNLAPKVIWNFQNDRIFAYADSYSFNLFIIFETTNASDEK